MLAPITLGAKLRWVQVKMDAKFKWANFCQRGFIPHNDAVGHNTMAGIGFATVQISKAPCS
uniref:Uncharacterized protein n=1 Tax=Romanomermis culicivorax TaxID=13658 RepID=A0A915HPE0_ROMCU